MVLIMYDDGKRPDSKRNRLREKQLELTLNELVIAQALTGCEPKKSFEFIKINVLLYGTGCELNKTVRIHKTLSMLLKSYIRNYT